MPGTQHYTPLKIAKVAGFGGRTSLRSGTTCSSWPVFGFTGIRNASMETPVTRGGLQVTGTARRSTSRRGRCASPRASPGVQAGRKKPRCSHRHMSSSRPNAHAHRLGSKVSELHAWLCYLGTATLGQRDSQRMDTNKTDFLVHVVFCSFVLQITSNKL